MNSSPLSPAERLRPRRASDRCSRDGIYCRRGRARAPRSDAPSSRRGRSLRRQRGYRRASSSSRWSSTACCFSRWRTAARRCTSRRCSIGPRPALTGSARVNRVTAFNLRLPSALYAIAGVVLTIVVRMGAARRGRRDTRRADFAGSYQYVSEGRVGRVDMTLYFFRDARDDELSLDFTDRVRSFDCWR